MRFQSKMDMFAVGAVNHIMSIPDANERESRLKSLRDAIDTSLSLSPDTDDPYNYRKMIREILLNL